MLAGRISRVQSGELLVGAIPAVIGGVGAPVESAGDDVVAALRVGVVVASGLDNVDFAGCGPGAVFVVDGEEPDGRPEPVAFGHLGNHLDSTVPDRGSLFRIDAAGLDRWHDGTVGDVGGRIAVIELFGCAANQGQVVVGGDEFFVLKGRFDEEFAILYVNIFLRVGCLVEQAITGTTN